MYFGPYLLPLDISGVLTSVGDYRTHKVVGIVSETLSTLKSMGAALEPRDGEAVEDLHHLVSFPRREALGSTDDVFNRPHISRHIILSRASLADVVCVKSQKAYGRCVGLYIEHGNGVIEVLGQWDPADKGSICDVFEDRNGGTLDAITFVYSDLDQPSDRTVESIVVGRGEGIDIPKFVWDDHTRVSESTTLRSSNSGRRPLLTRACRSLRGCFIG